MSHFIPSMTLNNSHRPSVETLSVQTPRSGTDTPLHRHACSISSDSCHSLSWNHGCGASSPLHLVERLLIESCRKRRLGKVCGRNSRRNPKSPMRRTREKGGAFFMRTGPAGRAWSSPRKPHRGSGKVDRRTINQRSTRRWHEEVSPSLIAPFTRTRLAPSSPSGRAQIHVAFTAAHGNCYGKAFPYERATRPRAQGIDRSRSSFQWIFAAQANIATFLKRTGIAIATYGGDDGESVTPTRSPATSSLCPRPRDSR